VPFNEVLGDDNFEVEKSQLIWVPHVINEVAVDTRDIHQIKEDSKVKTNRRLSIQALASG